MLIKGHITGADGLFHCGGPDFQIVRVIVQLPLFRNLKGGGGGGRGQLCKIYFFGVLCHSHIQNLPIVLFSVIRACLSNP